MYFIRELKLSLKSICYGHFYDRFRDVSLNRKNHMTFRRLFFNNNKIYFTSEIQ